MLNDFFLEFRRNFPDFTVQVDLAYIKRWSETVDPDLLWFWFESIADVLNKAMKNKDPVADYSYLFEYFSEKYRIGSEDEKACIDKSIIENLFWKVSPSNSKPYWEKLPDNLQQLYKSFFNKSPMRYFEEGF
ncbi:hypothetical protein JQC92_15810 [Shewanella sp. 202IG2-18]|uniref:DUF7674 family protein n=1 Tax=Parashewanella hymeniacidonis TaxID=2807618 RepID=UPI001961008C|nr:hypothetical protein [Parashewanella hymeniacidonis]MBM7073480.1 hypothetical protein [Parashewanella hymeniacidonis]